MAEPWNWTEQDLQRLIDHKTQESSTLDYKACDALAKTDGKKREISKDVSAFANSAGGTIVYGVVENDNLPIRIDDGFDPTDISREWLEQVINSGIQRRIDGVRIACIELSNTHPGRVAYVVHIPQSTRAPHQASDYRFYKRFNFQSVAMEEYEVRDVARRLEAGEPEAFLQPLATSPMALRFSDESSWSEPVAFRISVGNNSPVPVECLHLNLFVDRRLQVVDATVFRPTLSFGEGQSEVRLSGRSVAVDSFGANWGPPSRMPLLHGVEFHLSEEPFRVAFPRVNGEYVVGWRILAPRVPPRMRLYLLSLDGTSVATIARPMVQGEFWLRDAN